MSGLSEKELLLLSNYLYFDKCTEYGTINEMLEDCRGADGNISADKVAALGLGGCMSTQEAVDIIAGMDGCSESFKNLSASRSLDAGGIRAVCFEAGDNSATIVFRGTGGDYEPWADNVRGEFLSDTKMQKLADDFVRYDCGVYDDITVSGHSKGGNLAQYVSILNDGRVNRCVSFDGQGFGHEFINRYREEIMRAGSRIKSISAHNDYVNILLTAIAGERIYVKNLYNDPVGAHSSYALYKSCEFDGAGNIMNTAGQGFIAKTADAYAAGITGLMDALPNGGGTLFGELLAANVAAFFSSEMSDEFEHDKKEKAGSEVAKYIASLAGMNTDGTFENISLAADEVYVDPAGLMKTAEMLSGLFDEAAKISDRLIELRHEINYKAASKLAVDIILNKTEKMLSENAGSIKERAEDLEEISGLYSSRESQILGCIGSIAFA